jgi:predicted transposase YbfD/YdcC
VDTIFVECFGGIKDPRVERTRKHLLLDIIGIALCAVISGAQNWEEIEDFGQSHQAWLSGFLLLPNGIPSHDTIARVFSALDPSNFQTACMDWLQKLKDLKPETVIAIDGKTIKGSSRKRSGLKGLHIINAWSCSNGISLGQLKVEDKSNEITAVPKILKQLVIKGAIITMDAMGCQSETVKDICEAEADYIIALKGNQGSLHETVKDSFQLYDSGSKSLSVNSAFGGIDSEHGRIDERKIDVIDALQLGDILPSKWHSLNSLIRITSKRNEAGEVSTEQRYYISSLNPINPEKILGGIRNHWQIENCLHWSLDVSFNEDGSRIRDENAALNFSWLRKFALGLLKKETSFKASIRRKQRKSGMKIDYLAKVISGN